MSNTYFKFKQFTVHQDLCAMKVGTDGVLLGAWTNADKAHHILDVGTGTGLIALMLAQKNPQAVIDAIDIDKKACRQASDNVNKSIYKERIQIIQQSFLDFETEKKYDLIVSNPPYFSRSLKSPVAERNMARHNDTLPLKQLIRHSLDMLSEKGQISLILPMILFDELNLLVATNSLFIHRMTNVIPKEESPPKRILIELSKSPCVKNTIDCLILETKEHLRTDEYSLLTNDFYIRGK